jgi:hypothetical protein
MHKFILLGVLPAIAMARPGSSPFFFRRTEYKTCEELGMQDCGGCIPLDHTCCPQEVGGCPADMRCVVTDNGNDGCCPDDFVCTGDGSVISTTFSPAPTTSLSLDTPEASATTVAEVDTSSSAEQAPTLTATDSASAPTEEPQSTEDADAGQSSTSEAAAFTSETAAPTGEAAASTSETGASTSEDASRDSTSTAASDATTTSAASYSISTVYTTTTKTITSCAASSPCQSGTGASSIVLVTETVSVSTTLCPIPTTKDQDKHTTSLLPIIKPSITCPGHNEVCHPIVSTGVPTYSSGLNLPTTTGVPQSEYSSGLNLPTTTGIAQSEYSSGLNLPTTTSTQAVVTAGAARAGVAVGMGAMVVGFGVVQGVF